MKNENENSGLLSFITSIVKKSIDVPADVEILSENVKILAREIIHVANSVSKLSKIVKEHHEAINQIFAMQTVIISNMKNSTMDSQFPDLHKEKSEKPN
jgi:hypothetical protein